MTAFVNIAVRTTPLRLIGLALVAIAWGAFDPAWPPLSLHEGSGGIDMNELDAISAQYERASMLDEPNASRLRLLLRNCAMQELAARLDSSAP